MRLDYNIRDGKLVKTRAPEESSVRGREDAPYQKYLESMKEDIFEVRDGESVPIPLLSLFKQEFNALNSNIADSTAGLT